MIRGKTVEEYLENSGNWKSSLEVLREIMLETDMEESIKWFAPAYGFGKKNIVGLAAFKNYVGLWFHQGVFLKDEEGKLQNAQERTKAMRQWRFSSAKEVSAEKKLILKYVFEAIDNHENGREILPFKNTSPVKVPAELKMELSKNKNFNIAFEQLSLACRREYANYITEAKRKETKQRRLEKIKPMIIDGVGLNDKYKGC